MCGGGRSVCYRIGGNKDRKAKRERGIWSYKGMPQKNPLLRGNHKFHLMKSHKDDKQTEHHFVNMGSSAG